jgi:hypothetical protein
MLRDIAEAEMDTELPELSQQDVFDIGVVHLIDQGQLSTYTEKVDDCAVETMCAYRGASGLRCAAGVFIPETLYHRGMEDEGVDGMPDHLRGEEPLRRWAEDLFSDQDWLLEGLQRAHDSLLELPHAERRAVRQHWARALRSIEGVDSTVLNDIMSEHGVGWT